MADLTGWRSIWELNSSVPDYDYPSTVDNLRFFGATQHLRCWRVQDVPVLEIDEYQLNDDPEARESIEKIASIRQSIRSGLPLPPVVTLHRLGERWPYNLIEGRHRFNAAHEERVPTIRAYVAHLGCCGGPNGDFGLGIADS